VPSGYVFETSRMCNFIVSVLAGPEVATDVAGRQRARCGCLLFGRRQSRASSLL
jgi:hypothetical protein